MALRPLISPLLHRRFPELAETLPHLRLCALPTPVREMAQLARESGSSVPLWLKDDGHTTPLWGGNKPRKLEWVLADVLRRRRRTILTFGGLGTNHGVATALHAREHGIRTVLALVDQPVDEHVAAQLARLRARASRVYETHGVARTAVAVPYLLARHAQLSPLRAPYWLPPGGSSRLGTVGFVEAALELAAQVQAGELPEPDSIVIALGSGGSAAGLLAGLRIAGLRTRVVAVLVSDQLKLSERVVVRLAGRTLSLLSARGADVGGARVDAGGIEVVRGFLGDGYGHHTPEAGRASSVAAETEGLDLEPVYTAKALAALLARARDGSLGPGPVLYWHTHSATAPPALEARLSSP